MLCNNSLCRSLVCNVRVQIQSIAQRLKHQIQCSVRLSHREWRDAIPNIVHYVYAMKDFKADITFEFRHFLAVYSAWVYLSPETIYIHADVS